MRFKLIIKYGEQTSAQRGCVFVWPGASLARSSDLHSSPRWRLRGDTCCVDVATKSPRSNQKTLAGVTADDNVQEGRLVLCVNSVFERHMVVIQSVFIPELVVFARKLGRHILEVLASVLVLAVDGAGGRGSFCA